MKLETNRLLLRLWVPGDVVRLGAIHSHPDMAPSVGSRTTLAEAAKTIERYMGHWETRGFGRWAVTDRATRELIGRVGLMYQESWEASPDKVEIGWLIDRARWGRGLATEAATAAIQDGFERVGLRRIVSWTDPDNHASRRVMEKCGFRYEGRAAWKGSEVVWYALDARYSRSSN